MENLNSQPKSLELDGKINQFAVNACVSPVNIESIDSRQLQEILRIYDKISNKEGLEQALDVFLEGIYKLCISTDDFRYQLVELMVEPEDITLRQLLKEFYWLMFLLSNEDTHNLLQLRKMFILNPQDIDKELMKLKKNMGIDKEIGGKL